MNMFYTGINLSGAEAERGTKRGRYGYHYSTPDKSHYDYWFNNNSDMNVARLPFRWERLQNTPFAELNGDFLAKLRQQVSFAAQKGADIILDVHNFGSYSIKLPGGREEERFIGDSSLPLSAFKDLWVKLAQEFKDDKHVWFGLMNEPKTEYTAKEWAGYMQETVNAVRNVGANNKILLSGVQWSSAVTWRSSGNAAAFANFKDPANNSVFETHQYFDPAGTGMSGAIINDPVSRLKTITDWARETGNELFLGEFGISFNSPAFAAKNAAGVKAALNYLADNADVWKGWAAWGAGELWGDQYHYKLTPNFTQSGRPYQEQSEANWLKNYVRDLGVVTPKPSVTVGDAWTEKQAPVKEIYEFEAEDANLSGGYRKEKTFAASDGFAVNTAGGGEGRLQFSFNGQAGEYRIKTHFFDESDGKSGFSLWVNGKEIDRFKADRNFQDPTRSVRNLTEHLSDKITLRSGDSIVLKGVKNGGELASADRLELISAGTETETAFAELTDLTPAHVKAYDHLQDLSAASAKVAADGESVTLTGNHWKAIGIDYDFTENTVVSFDFSSTKRSEAHAIGFDTDNVFKGSEGSFVTLGGADTIGRLVNRRYAGDGMQNFTFRTGNFLAGQKNKLVLVNDDDKPNDGTGNGTFANIRIYEAHAEVRGDANANILNATDNSEELFGGAGGDSFFLKSSSLRKIDIVKDFNVKEGDKLDLTALTDGAAGFNIGLIKQFISLTVNGKDGSAELSFDLDGAGGGEIFRTIALFDKGLQGQSLNSLLTRGALKV